MLGKNKLPGDRWGEVGSWAVGRAIPGPFYRFSPRRVSVSVSHPPPSFSFSFSFLFTFPLCQGTTQPTQPTHALPAF